MSSLFVLRPIFPRGQSARGPRSAIEGVSADHSIEDERTNPDRSPHLSEK
jgi:hypothetical protein